MSFVSIIIPIHNEEPILEYNIRQLLALLKQIDEFEWELLLIENGSRDQTKIVARVLSHEDKRIKLFSLDEANYGLALKHGFFQARGQIIVNFDIDYWDVEFVRVCARIMEIKYDIIIACKSLLLSKDRRDLIRKMATYGFRMILFFVFGLRVADTHGTKAWKNCELIRRCFECSVPTHHTYDTEVIIRAVRGGAEVLEVPIEVTESKEATRGMLKRVPRALYEMLQLRWRLWKEPLVLLK